MTEFLSIVNNPMTAAAVPLTEKDYSTQNEAVSDNHSQQSNDAFLSEYISFIGATSHVYYQQPRNETNTRWLGNSAKSITPSMIEDHLNGKVTLSTYFRSNGYTSLCVADDDHGGIDAAQEAVNALLDCGLVAFALCYESLNFDGTARHNGSHLYLKLNSPVKVDDAQAALKVILAETSYSTDEIQSKLMLPFGSHKWARNTYGTLVTPCADPVVLTDASEQGLAIIAEIGILDTRNDVDMLLSFLPVPVAIIPESLAEVKKQFIGANDDVIKAFNARYGAFDILMECGFTVVNRHNARCFCNKHTHNDVTASIGVSPNDEKIYFNAPACDYRNQGRHYTAFSLMQTIRHGGNFKSALDEARATLNMPFKPITQRTKPAVELPRVAPVEDVDETMLRALRCDYKEYAATLNENHKAVLRVLLDKGRKSGGCVSITWKALAAFARVSLSTAQRAIRKFIQHSYVRKYADANEANQVAPCVIQLISPRLAEHIPALTSYGVQEKVTSTPCTPFYAQTDEIVTSTLSIKEKNIITSTKESKTEIENDGALLSLFNSPDETSQPDVETELQPAAADGIVLQGIIEAYMEFRLIDYSTGEITKPVRTLKRCMEYVQEQTHNAYSEKIIKPLYTTALTTSRKREAAQVFIEYSSEIEKYDDNRLIQEYEKKIKTQIRNQNNPRSKFFHRKVLIAAEQIRQRGIAIQI